MKNCTDRGDNRCVDGSFLRFKKEAYTGHPSLVEKLAFVQCGETVISVMSARRNLGERSSGCHQINNSKSESFPQLLLLTGGHGRTEFT